MSATVLTKYELMVIFAPSLNERDVAPTLQKFLEVVLNEKGVIDKVDIWGRRLLAYPIAKQTEGTYAVVQFTATSVTVDELERQLRLSEHVLRTKVLRAEDAHGQLRRPRRA